MPLSYKRLAIIITGPTSSGKSALALELAGTFNGVIINADSVQLYHELPILSAQPAERDFSKVSHQLYSILSGDQYCTAFMWAQMVLKVLEETYTHNQLPFIVGGTGFYLKTLLEGLSPVPPVPPDIRNKAIQHCQNIGLKNFFKELESIDPGAAKHIGPHDYQRITRAWEVFHATGRPLSWWQSSPKIPFTTSYHFLTFCLNPPREDLLKKADFRLENMISQGALEEVKMLLTQYTDRSAPVFRTLGACQLADYLEGLSSLDSALKNTQSLTHAYIKRQQTWFRHQLKIDHTIENFYCKDAFRYAESVIKQFNY
jgi:tRNA dimethylallyltransferase